MPGLVLSVESVCRAQTYERVISSVNICDLDINFANLISKNIPSLYDIHGMKPSMKTSLVARKYFTLIMHLTRLELTVSLISVACTAQFSSSQKSEYFNKSPLLSSWIFPQTCHDPATAEYWDQFLIFCTLQTIHIFTASNLTFLVSID